MVPFTDLAPEPRLMERLISRLRRTGDGAAFIAAGEALALEVASCLGNRPLPDWVDQLADVMAAALLRVQDTTMDDATSDERVALSRASAVLSILRPELSAACDASISVWMAVGLVAPEAQVAVSVLSARTLLALHLDDVVQAEACVARLFARGDEERAFLLSDWVVTRRQGHGYAREEWCFTNFRVQLTRPEVADPVLFLLAALVAHTRRFGLNRQRLLERLSRLALPPAQQTAARRSA